MCVHAELANMRQEKYVRRREDIKLNIGKELKDQRGEMREFRKRRIKQLKKEGEIQCEESISSRNWI